MGINRIAVFKKKQLSADSFQRPAGLYLCTDLSNEASIFFTSSLEECNASYSDTNIYSKSLDKTNWYSNSDAEPKAIFKNLANCGSEFRPQPSAMFVGIEDAERRIWLIRPYISSFGYSFVHLYISNTTLWALDQIAKSLKFFMNSFLGLIEAKSWPLKTDSLNYYTAQKGIPYKN